MTPPTSLERLNEDVIRELAARYLKPRGLLVNLASSSRRLRCYCMPILFSNCRVKASAREADRIPPVAIRPYVRHLVYAGGLSQSVPSCEELDYLPNICSITFDQAVGRVPISVLERCLNHSLVSLSFTNTSRSPVEPHTWLPPAISTLSNTLERLSYPTYPWKATRAFGNNIDIEEETGLDLRYIGSIVLGMHSSAKSLALPVDAIPLAAMSKLPWPNLRDLGLTGRYLNESHARSLQRLLRLLDSPRSISVLVAQPLDCARAPVCGRRSTSTIDTSQLQSLSIAYPDPDDTIVSKPCMSLLRLSLRDYPRYYIRNSPLHVKDMKGLATPILSSSECLRILTRMAALSLEHLELVYESDQAEEELLLHVASSYPRLHAIQIHQYRTSRGSDALNFKRIAAILASTKTLRTVHLHLDYEDSPSSYDFDPPRLKQWPSRLARYGGDMLETLERGCPVLEGLFLLHQDESEKEHFWVKFLPTRYPGRSRIDWDWLLERPDCEPPYRHCKGLRRTTGSRLDLPMTW
ncbi:hypothetical protein K466DRAFT_289700 [Polyporus arcularius HHB13444]|uniref:F-box domain-containing protein n=1 Tax=Polyporus arcularius HHB13444 TaxID=1314778 RepID=A0A5C3NZA1_9APHY|nr:hypothetical protein K466DRAFT_289700 [Polyporus arcularius HHB13444]